MLRMYIWLCEARVYLLNVMFKNEVKMVVNTLNFVLPSDRMFGHDTIGRGEKIN